MNHTKDDRLIKRAYKKGDILPISFNSPVPPDSVIRPTTTAT